MADNNFLFYHKKLKSDTPLYALLLGQLYAGLQIWLQ